MDDAQRSETIDYCTNAFKCTSGLYGHFFRLAFSEPQIKGYYEAVTIQARFASHPENSGVRDAARRKALYFFRLAEAQAFFHWLESGQYVFNKECARAKVNGSSLITLDRYVLDFWEN
ncbi:hypothetical protein HY490_00130 [Candidatus Woesearchaeota archaeon]|nr:hypothetical protein [Candidatus Woesearchaeota archaeon]